MASLVPIPEPPPDSTPELIYAYTRLVKVTEIPEGTIPELRYREKVDGISDASPSTSGNTRSTEGFEEKAA